MKVVRRMVDIHDEYSHSTLIVVRVVAKRVSSFTTASRSACWTSLVQHSLFEALLTHTVKVNTCLFPKCDSVDVFCGFNDDLWRMHFVHRYADSHIEGSESDSGKNGFAAINGSDTKWLNQVRRLQFIGFHRFRCQYVVVTTRKSRPPFPGCSNKRYTRIHSYNAKVNMLGIRIKLLVSVS
jgi:hypothetical protein